MFKSPPFPRVTQILKENGISIALKLMKESDKKYACGDQSLSVSMTCFFYGLRRCCHPLSYLSCTSSEVLQLLQHKGFDGFMLKFLEVQLGHLPRRISVFLQALSFKFWDLAIFLAKLSLCLFKKKLHFLKTSIFDSRIYNIPVLMSITVSGKLKKLPSATKENFVQEN